MNPVLLDGSERFPMTVVLSPDQAAIAEVGASLQLNATVFDEANEPIESPTITWSITDPELADIDEAGVVTAKAAGAVLAIAVAGTAADTARIDLLQPVPEKIQLSADSVALDALGASVLLTAKVFGTPGELLRFPGIYWKSTNGDVVTVDDRGEVRATGEGSAIIVVTAGDVADSTHIEVTVPSDEITVRSRNSAGVRAALNEAASRGGGTVRFPSGTYDLKDWPDSGITIDVPITLRGDGDAVLRGNNQMYLFDLGRQTRIEGLTFERWQRPIRFVRAANWSNDGVDSEYIRVLNSRFEDVAVAIEGRRESGSSAPANAHRLSILQVEGNTFLRTRRAVDFRRVLIDRFEFTDNTARDVVHRNPEPDVPLPITTLLQLGADLEDTQMRATEVVIRGNDIRNVTNQDPVNGRAYAILAYRGPTIVEDNHIENVTAANGSDDGAAAIYQRSRTYARFARNRVVNGTNTSNVAAVFAKQGGAEWDVLDNEIVFTDDFRALHNSPDYTAFEATHARIRFEGNTVRGATRQFVTRIDTNNLGRDKAPLLIRNNEFMDCERGSAGRSFTLGYRRSVIEVSGNTFTDCAASGGEFIFVNSTDNFAETDSLTISDNEWRFTRPDVRVPSRVFAPNAYARVTRITGNEYRYVSSRSDSPPIALAFLTVADGDDGARITIAGNHVEGFREGTSGPTSIIETRATFAELVVENNRAVSGGNFLRFATRAPVRAIVRDNDARGITGQLIRNDASGGELIVSGNKR